MQKCADSGNYQADLSIIPYNLICHSKLEKVITNKLSAIGNILYKTKFLRQKQYLCSKRFRPWYNIIKVYVVEAYYGKCAEHYK